MERDSALVRHRGDRGGVVRAQGLGHGIGVGVLDLDEAGDWVVRIVRVAEGLGDVPQVERSVRPLPELADRGPHDDRVTRRLVNDHVAVGAGNRFLAPSQVGELRDQVAHGAAGDEQAGLLAEQFGRSFLQRTDGRILAEDVVANLRVRHRAPHFGGRHGDRVGPQVYEGHGTPSIGEGSGNPDGQRGVEVP